MNSPLVSIVLSVYNASKYLEVCLDSILSQTYENWELVLINDASTDASGEIIEQYIEKYFTNDVHYIQLPRNRGIPYCFNLGIQKAKGKYIARIDADDLMFEDRLVNQVQFLEAHENVSVLGSCAIETDENGNDIGLMTVPLDNYMIKKSLFSTCPIIHPSVMIRRTIFSNGLYYRDLYPRSEDLDLWLRLSAITNFANLENPLIKKRSHSEQVTMSKYGHYDSFKAKVDFFLKNGILIKNMHYLIKHVLVILFIPNTLYILLKKDDINKRKNNYNALKKRRTESDYVYKKITASI